MGSTMTEDEQVPAYPTPEPEHFRALDELADKIRSSCDVASIFPVDIYKVADYFGLKIYDGNVEGGWIAISKDKDCAPSVGIDLKVDKRWHRYICAFCVSYYFSTLRIESFDLVLTKDDIIRKTFDFDKIVSAILAAAVLIPDSVIKNKDVDSVIDVYPSLDIPMEIMIERYSDVKAYHND